MNAGLETLTFYAPHYYLDLKELARERGVDPDKYTVGIAQEKMAVPAPDEDVVTMGANAAARALRGVNPSDIDTLMFATESGVDQSKAAAIYVHSLLGLPSTTKAFELKQACCSSTAGLQMALALVAQKPHKKVLLVASDIARYGLGTAGEPTQGAGAVAMVISSRPKLIAFDPESGSYTEDVMDFWRPNYMDEALVDGKYSIKIYLKALAHSWDNYVEESGRCFEDLHRFCYHLPFTKMAEKAHLHLAKMNHMEHDGAALREQIEHSLLYNRMTGNCYTASLYEGLLSLLENAPEDLTGKRIGLFSYGSGCMASFFSGQVLKGYRDTLDTAHHRRMFETRRALPYEEYAAFYSHLLPTDGRDYAIAPHEAGRYRLAGVKDHKRAYEHVAAAPAAKPTARAKKYAAA
jgi:hydroxymethylglutaryl-CoA synthase